MELNQYQQLASRTDNNPRTGPLSPDDPAVLTSLMGLAGHAGELLSQHKKWLRDGESHQLSPDRTKEELGDILWYLAAVAAKHEISLQEVADANLKKARERWAAGPDGPRPALFDDGYPKSEQLPRIMNISVQSQGSGGTLTYVNSEQLGSYLTDNRYEDDGYRFHDIFHLAYAAVLGWSPTVRALLGRKRKSNPETDRIEDGRQAILIEEGISAMVFSYAERRNFLDGARALDYDLLRNIKSMTAHLEVSDRTQGEWERAITTGFDAWRQVKETGGGQLQADLERGTLVISG